LAYTIAGRRAVITGASSGIGQGAARRLAELGASLVLCSRRQERLQELAAEICDAGGTAIVAAGDVTDTETLDRIVATATQHLGGIDILINCAGVAGPVSFADTTPERARSYLEVNYLAPVELCRRVLPVMERQGSGYIVNVASFAGLKGLPTYATYGASKAALICFSDALRHEYARQGIRVSVLCPPGVDTPMVRDVLDDHADWFFKFRLLTVEQVVSSLVRNMRKQRFLILPSLDIRISWLLLRLFPRSFTWLMARLYSIET
jgi:short-subunit dehydrogenase